MFDVSEEVGLIIAGIIMIIGTGFVINSAELWGSLTGLFAWFLGTMGVVLVGAGIEKLKKKK